MTRLLLDAMLGGLRPYLRICGHDTVYALEAGLEADDRVLEYASETDRTVVTRDRDLAARAGSALLLECRDVDGQLARLRAAGLSLEPTPEPAFCGACNGSLAPVGPTATTPDYAPDPAARDVWRCADCGQHFWKGSHWDDVVERLVDLPAE